jgi:hypothetical protein
VLVDARQSSQTWLQPAFTKLETLNAAAWALVGVAVVSIIAIPLLCVYKHRKQKKVGVAKPNEELLGNRNESPKHKDSNVVDERHYTRDLSFLINPEDK